jgi:membrane protein required for colicin V production
VEVDLALLAFLAGAFALGYVRGGVRQLIALGAWLVAFVVAAFLRAPVADWIGAQAPQFSRDHVDMLAYLLLFLVLFGVALLVIEVGGKTLHLTERVIVDRFVGGLLALGVAVLTIGSLIVILDTYYRVGSGPGTAAAELGIVTDVANALDRSAIVRSLGGSLVPGLIALLGPLLPADVRAVYA